MSDQWDDASPAPLPHRPGGKRKGNGKAKRVDPGSLDRLPPHSLEAEQGVIACCLLDPRECVDAVRLVLGVGEGFYDLRHQLTFDAMCQLQDKGTPLELITLQQHLKDRGELDQVGGLAYLSILPDAVPSSANLQFYLDIVAEKAALRRVAKAAVEIAGGVHECEDVPAYIAQSEEAFLKATEARVKTGAPSIVELVFETTKILETTWEHRGKGLQDPSVMATPWPHMNKLLAGGARPGEMVVVAARPRMGKTSMMTDWAWHQAVVLRNAAKIYSYEMKAMPALVLRLACAAAQAHYSNVLQGFISQDEKERLLEAFQKLVGSKRAVPAIPSSPLYIEDRPLTVSQLRADARRAVQRDGVRIIFVDYLTIIPPDDAKLRMDPVTRATVTSEAIKAMAKELSVPVVVLCQLSRAIEKDAKLRGDEFYSRPPMLADLRESGSIEQDLDTGLMLWKMPEPDEQDEPEKWRAWQDYRNRKNGEGNPEPWRPMCVRIAKQRNGPADMDVELAYQGTCMRFHDFYGGTGRVSGVAKNNDGREIIG